MKVKIYGERIAHGKCVERVEIGVAILDEDRISKRKYNELKRSMTKALHPAGKGQHHRMVDEIGRKTSFGGYPCDVPFVRFLEEG